MTSSTKTSTASSVRQQKRREQRGHLSRSTLLALVFVACAGLGVSQIHRIPEWKASLDTSFTAWSAKQGFTIENVNVTGRKQVPAAFIIQALQITRGAAILSYDPQQAQARLSENPWFKTVHVERRLPNTIFVRLEERIPAARWQMNGKLALVDADGVALTTENMERYTALPIIIGQDARHKIVNLFTLLQGEPDIGRQLDAATWIGNRRWDLKLKSGILIRLPAGEPETALSQLAALNKEQHVLEKDLVSIDLRLQDQAILQPTLRANAVIERPDFSDKPDASKKNI